MKSRVTDRNDWFELWQEDKECMLETMVKNMAADLDAGYNYFGNCIKNQKEIIDEYQKAYENRMYEFASMSDKEVNKWCFYDMKVRGVIE